MGTSCIVAYTVLGKKYLLENLSRLKPIGYDEIYKENKFIEESETLGVNRAKFFSMIKDYKAWDHVERLYPPKYPIKKLLIMTVSPQSWVLGSKNPRIYTGTKRTLSK